MTPEQICGLELGLLVLLLVAWSWLRARGRRPTLDAGRAVSDEAAESETGFARQDNGE